MDRHEEGGAPDRQPPQEVQLHQQLNDSTSLEAAPACARLNPAHELDENAREKGSARIQGEIAHACTKAHVDSHPRPAAAAPVQAPARPLLRLYTLEEIKSRPSPQWLIEGFLPQGALCVLYGSSGCGKSFIALDWALSIARGVPWFGHAISQGLVVYIAAEGGTGLKQRIFAWEAARSCMSVNTWIIEQAVDLLGKDSATGLIDAVSQKLPAQPILIIFDTLARCLVGGDENSAKDVGQAIATPDEIRFRTGACVLAVHHSGKVNSSRERGSSALRGAADTMLKVESSQDTMEVIVDKQKDAEPASPVFLQLVPQGQSCALAPADEHKTLSKKTLSKHAETILEVLAELAPMSYNALREASKLTESTFNRTRRKLETQCAIQKNNDGEYELADLGNRLVGRIKVELS
jgi:AAA domain